MRAGILSQETVGQIRNEAQAEAEAALEQALAEPKPVPSDVYKYSYAPSRVDPVYPEDYNGLPS